MIHTPKKTPKIFSEITAEIQPQISDIVKRLTALEEKVVNLETGKKAETGGRNERT